jgi:protein-L-isoaspartate(D-aspartate) O-methyltransferase
MMEDEGLSVGIEHIPQLYKKGLETVSKSHLNLIEENKIILIEGDGRKGCEKYSPYNFIHVGAAVEQVPEELINQLANGGRLMIPVGVQNSSQYIYLIDKDVEGNLTKNAILPVRYVPLTSIDDQLGNKL